MDVSTCVLKDSICLQRLLCTHGDPWLHSKYSGLVCDFSSLHIEFRNLCMNSALLNYSRDVEAF